MVGSEVPSIIQVHITYKPSEADFLCITKYTLKLHQEALGHTDKQTTENYLDSFDNEVKKDFALMLTQFKSA